MEEEPKFIAWMSHIDQTPHIVPMDDFKSQVEVSFKNDILPPIIWDSLFSVSNNSHNRVKYQNFLECKDFFKGCELSFINKKKGHPLLIQNEKTLDYLSERYITEIKNIYVIYIYEDLLNNDSLIKKYIDELNMIKAFRKGYL